MQSGPEFLGIHNVASNLGPKLMGLYKYKQFEESEIINQRKNQSIWGAEDSYVLYFFSFLLFYFYFLRRLDLA